MPCLNLVVLVGQRHGTAVVHRRTGSLHAVILRE